MSKQDGNDDFLYQFRKEPPATFSQDLYRRLHAEPWEQTEIPFSARLRRVLPNLSPMLKLVNGIGVTVLLIVGLAVLFRPQQTISASQVLNYALEAQQGAQPSLTGYEGVISKQLNGGKTDVEEHVWRQFNLNRRVETYMNPLPTLAVQQLDSSVALANPGNPQLKLSSIDVTTTAHYRFWYNSQIHGAARSMFPDGRDETTLRFLVDGPGGMYGPGVGMLLFYERLSHNMQDVMGQIGSDVVDLRMVGEQTVASRRSYVLKFTVTGNQWWRAPKGTHVTAWIDQQLYILLGERWEDDGGNLISTWQFTSLTVNPVIDQSVFTFEPGGKVLIFDEQGQFRTRILDYIQIAAGVDRGAPITEANFSPLLLEIASQNSYKVFLPATFTALPDLMPSPPVSLSGVTFIKYQAVNNVMALIIVQGLPGDMSRFDPCTTSSAKCETISIGNNSGRYLENTEISVAHSGGVAMGYSLGPSQEDATVRWLSFEKDGTAILLRAEDIPAYHATEVSKTELIQVAASLQQTK